MRSCTRRSIDDGYELIREVRALEADHVKRIPAVAITGYVTPADRSRALAAGYQGHLGSRR